MKNKIIRGKLSDTELAYAAGIIDGEGCIGIHKHTDKRGKSRLHYLYVIVTNNNPECTKFFQNRFGGFIKERSPLNAAKNYQWYVRSENARNLLEILQPFILLKEKQTKLGIAFDRNKIRYKLSDKEWEKREKYYIEMRRLNSFFRRIKPHHLKSQPQRLNEGTPFNIKDKW